MQRIPPTIQIAHIKKKPRDEKTPQSHFIPVTVFTALLQSYGRGMHDLDVTRCSCIWHIRCSLAAVRRLDGRMKSLIRKNRPLIFGSWLDRGKGGCGIFWSLQEEHTALVLTLALAISQAIFLVNVDFLGGSERSGCNGHARRGRSGTMITILAESFDSGTFRCRSVSAPSEIDIPDRSRPANQLPSAVPAKHRRRKFLQRYTRKGSAILSVTSQ